MPSKDVVLKPDCCKELLLEKHSEYLKSCAPSEGSTEQIMYEHFKMSGIYWCLTALDLINGLSDFDLRTDILKFLSQCQHPSGGVSPSINHDPHILYTLSAIQIILIYDCIENPPIDLDAAVVFIQSMQQKDGSFAGDKHGEVDIRFSFCAIAALTILGRLDDIDVPAAVEFVMKCHNPIDGGFGSRPGSESHAGLVYCALGTLSLTCALDIVDADKLGWWLAERQLPSGGLNGRPEKLPDLCYSWWVLSSLQILGRLHWIDRAKLTSYILACQDSETGGFCDRPGNMVDPFHTLFGLAGISLLAHEYSRGSDNPVDFSAIKRQIKLINPVLCLPQDVINKRNLKMQLLSQ